MENKQTIKMVPGETTLENWFIWFRNTVLKFCNKQWVVTLPANKGNATVRDSDDKVTIDLTNVTFGGNAGDVVVAGTAPIEVTDATVGDVTTYTVAYDPAFTFTLDVIESGVFVRYTGVPAATRTEY